MVDFQSNRVLAVGEAMFEMAVVGPETYNRSFAGDTFNTAWHLSQIPGLPIDVGYVSKVGTDAVSDRFLELLAADGVDATWVGRDPDRTMGLYMIELDGAERSFSYWRDASAARCLADDDKWLDAAFAQAGLIHVSGITLGILSTAARGRLEAALIRARQAGACISFDPNYRPKLWASTEEARAATKALYSISDIALPSFDDEANLWGDASPLATLDRVAELGAAEIVLKDGAKSVFLRSGEMFEIPTAPAQNVKDTSGAGDAFNAGYLAARLGGRSPREAVTVGQALSAQVIGHFGARIPKADIPSLLG